MVTVIDYGMGNLGSIANMIKKMGGESVITSDKEVIAKAKKIVLPGVGAFDNAMKNIATLGIQELLNKKVLEEKIPMLGVCLGMQLLTKGSEEGILPGFGWIDAETKKFQLDASYKIPHMGWNRIKVQQPNVLIQDDDPDTRFYFVHSYYVKCHRQEDILATTTYGHEFTSAVHRDNIWGAQFHPEKSHKFGMRLFKNFLAL